VPVEISNFFSDHSVTDVAINAFDRVVYKRDGLWLTGESPFDSDSEFADWLVDLVESADGRLDFSHPAASVSQDGFRIHALIGGRVAANPSATLRRLKHPDRELRFDDLASQVRFDYLRQAIRKRQNILIAGSAGAGKTSLLRTLMSEVGTDRVVTIEDVTELQLDLPNVVSLVSRETNVEGAGEFGLNDLLVQALRMSPDRLVLGEIRGAELVVALNALNTGHSGAGATIHANTLQAVVSRLESLASLCGLSIPALARMVRDAFQLVVFVEASNGRRISGLARFTLQGDQLSIEPIHG
jgi:pilus assembly protein CpaF